MSTLLHKKNVEFPTRSVYLVDAENVAHSSGSGEYVVTAFSSVTGLVSFGSGFVEFNFEIFT